MFGTRTGEHPDYGTADSTLHRTCGRCNARTADPPRNLKSRHGVYVETLSGCTATIMYENVVIPVAQIVSGIFFTAHPPR
ncbi:MAG TPA: hypothetical protein VLL97_10710 [Acidobacteriota bacterium]|nr:hypothetical protein [Acidobacteriota bacterium]